ncbi:MAG TPA: hypothetical protein V6D20_04380 [Candidatus Obscuribacterales bacterium]
MTKLIPFTTRPAFTSKQGKIRFASISITYTPALMVNDSVAIAAEEFHLFSVPRGDGVRVTHEIAVDWGEKSYQIGAARHSNE